jgi:hypothetical protein
MNARLAAITVLAFISMDRQDIESFANAASAVTVTIANNRSRKKKNGLQ